MPVRLQVIRADLSLPVPPTSKCPVSLVATRVSLTHRCTIERDFHQGSDDGWGNPTVPTWATQTSSVAAAIWPAGSGLVRDLGRRDINCTHVIATNQNLSAVTKDRFYDGSVYYQVESVEGFVNSHVTAEVLYLHYCNLRTV